MREQELKAFFEQSNVIFPSYAAEPLFSVEEVKRHVPVFSIERNARLWIY